MAAVAIPLALLCSCSGDEYVAKVTELKLVSVNPTNGYPGEIVKILGRNFSPVASQNKVVRRQEYLNAGGMNSRSSFPRLSRETTH